MLRVDAAGFGILFHCHDELVCEVPEDSVDPEKFNRLVTTVPTWPEGMPIAARDWTVRMCAKGQTIRRFSGTHSVSFNVTMVCRQQFRLFSKARCRGAVWCVRRSKNCRLSIGTTH